jgi:hypothetical protein
LTAFEIAFHDSGWAVQMASSDSLPDLAFTGFWSVVLVVPMSGLLWLLHWTLPSPVGLNRELRFWRGRRRPVVIVSALAVIAIVFLEPFWPLGLTPLLVAVWFFGFRTLQGGQVKFLDIWWVILLLVAISAVGDGAGGVLGGYLQTADYRFDPSTGSAVANSRYQQYGEADGFVYLQKCGTSDIYIVNENDVASIRPPSQRPKRRGVDLLDVLFGAQPVVGAFKC